MRRRFGPWDKVPPESGTIAASGTWQESGATPSGSWQESGLASSTGMLEGILGREPKGYGGRARNPQATAWFVLSLAFATFILLLIGAIVLGTRYYETATETGDARLSLQAGIVLFRDSVTSTLINATDDLDLREGDELLVGQGARAATSLFEGTQIQLYPGSELAFSQLRKSRFHSGFTQVAVRVNRGSVRLEVPPAAVGEGRFRLETPYGSATLLPGSYGVDVTDQQSRISARSGMATAQSSVTGRQWQGVGIKAGEKIVLSPDGANGPLPEGDSLIKNGDFAQGFSQWTPLDQNEAGRPMEPGQRSLVGDKIAGRDAMALKVSRISPQGIHGETGLSQVINRDVSDYLSLRLRANVKVTGQSLSGGGYMGYEYPLMIRVRYREANGGQIDWTHGFFVSNPEDRSTPNGERVPRGEWIPYDGELMQLQPKPVSIIAVEVLGAGHTYDGSIANVELVGK